MSVFEAATRIHHIGNVDKETVQEPTDGDVLQFKSSSNLWEAVAASGLIEHIDSSAGSADAGKGIKLTSAGRLSQTMRHLWDLLTKTADYSMTINDEVVFADATSGNVTITLPPVFESKGLTYYIKKVNAGNTVTVIGTF